VISSRRSAPIAKDATTLPEGETNMEKLGEDIVTVSDRGLRHGLFFDRFGRLCIRDSMVRRCRSWVPREHVGARAPRQPSVTESQLEGDNGDTNGRSRARVRPHENVAAR
jgi:hypothetical protein